MNINNFESYFSNAILERGEQYFINNKVSALNEIKPDVYSAYVYGQEKYNANITMENKGNILFCSCSCAFPGYCEHIAAALYKLRDSGKYNVKVTSSYTVTRLVRAYMINDQIESDYELNKTRPVEISVELNNSYFERLEYFIKVGFKDERKYTVRNQKEFFNNFDNKITRSYGKQLSFRHDTRVIDESCMELFNTLRFICSASDEFYRASGKSYQLHGADIDIFFKALIDKKVTFGLYECPVLSADPKIQFRIEKANKGYMLEQLSKKIICYGGDQRMCFFDIDKKTFYLSSERFTALTKPFYYTVTRDEKLYIAEDDIRDFFITVIRPLMQFTEIDGIDLLDEYEPPTAEIRLYLDVNDDDIVTGRLEFHYDDIIYNAFGPRNNDAFIDVRAENKARYMVHQYFETDGDQLYIRSDNGIYNFISHGINELNSFMDIYASDKFKRISSITPVTPKIGITPQSELLNLTVTADGYTAAELIELLGAYRRGKKYHRLKKGPFVFMNEGLAELDNLTRSLNITDKELLGENISVPMYRMLYLDSLQSDPDGMRIKRSRAFKDEMRRYNDTLSVISSSDVPKELENVMRDYQKEGFRWMKLLCAYKFGGILADDMGLGKTIQAIALMLDAKNDGKGKSLIVCPSSLLLNWSSEIRKFAPQLKAVVISGTAHFRKEQISYTDDYDVIITSYQTLICDIRHYSKMSFYLQFIDEAQYIKNHSTQISKAVKGINADVKFALTGTPVENNLAELWSIFDFIMPGYLFKYTSFKKNYEKPIVTNHSESSVAALQKLTSPFILRRMKKDVLTELPEKTETVLCADMSPEQSAVYSANVAEMLRSFTNNDTDSGQDKIKILSMITKLRQLCCDPSLVYENYAGGSAKLDLCMELVESCINSGHKLLLFSQFTSMLSIISQKFDKAGIKYYMLTGSTKPQERIRLVNKFNNNDVNVFLISLKAGGTGLNLTGADIVIHYDPWWNSSAENQASDRVYRIGQKRNVHIYKLITSGTIEEKIIDIQKKKSELADIALKGEGDIMKMSVSDIIKILE